MLHECVLIYPMQLLDYVCRFADFAEVVEAEASSLTLEAELISAGAVAQGPGYGTGNECAYGRTYRVARRGGDYIATHADYPEPSVYVSVC
jgi:hypothetical protein